MQRIKECAVLPTAKCSYGKAIVQLPLRGVQLFEQARKLMWFSLAKTETKKMKLNDSKIKFFNKL